MLVNMKKMLADAKREGYTVPSFNCFNYEMIPMIIKEANRQKSPTIIAAQKRGLEYTGIKPFVQFVRACADEVEIPIALHLDHAPNYEFAKKCFQAGFTSALVNTAHLPLDENIKLTQKVVELANQYNASVEGELGLIEGDEDGRNISAMNQSYTDPLEAKIYVDSTGIDALAVSIRTVHYKRKEPISPDYELFERIKDQVDIPFVLHGGASVTDKIVTRVSKSGFNKYNINYQPNHAYINGLKSKLTEFKEETENGRFHLPVARIFSEIETEVQKVVAHWIQLLGSGGKI